ncbi:hypothetical protein PsW64_05206 [Pseudovibrio sp. W64]|uniref:hypothetical protein n=1 Tax=Pseudovibrio sp. W64 TaxID=1735583 RepID=UPI0007AE944A|nr:hypothetical protein [Pseudovibrio sp. W64]KZK76477.1 hypothetical protein PsW64_05206 [Pseudovibrio sp. W64]
MPHAVALGVAFVLSNGAAILGASVATQAILAGAAVSSVGVGIIGVGLSAGVGYAVKELAGTQRRQSNAAPLPSVADGKVNQRQSVPSRSFAYGLVRKAGDMMFLEERDGTAYMIIAHASHEIDGFVEHYLSDAAVEIDEDGNVIKSLSNDEDASKYYRLSGKAKVIIKERLGTPVGEPYSELVTKFSDIWSDDHRGDNIASTLVICKSVSAQHHRTVYPHGYPTVTSLVRAKRVLDPRTDEVAFSRNLALHRLDLLLSPYGGALKPERINLESWANAAAVADEQVTNFQGDQEPRYHGGFSGRENNDPTEVARLIDEAGELLLYVDLQGKVAVHAGEWVEPDIHLKTADIKEVTFLSNRNPNSNVKSVRGLWTNPELNYTEDDAVIWGDPYVDENDPRSRTVDNECIQSHNHMRRKQKLKYIRATAPRVRIVCDYFASENLPFRRFIKITEPPHLVDAYLELIGTPILDLNNFTHQFEAIVVPKSLYDFEPEEEGEKGDPPQRIGSSALPIVTSFTIAFEQQGQSLIAEASFSRGSEALTYELEYMKTSGGAAKYAQANDGEETIETESLTARVEYRFRMRTRSVFGQNSSWSNPVVHQASI